MLPRRTRREFLIDAGAAAVASVVACAKEPAVRGYGTSRPAAGRPRVVIARDEVLTRSVPAEHQDLLNNLLSAAMQRLTGAADARIAWRKLFSPNHRIGIKVNTLGLSTQPSVVVSIVAGLREAGIPAGNIIIWDRFDTELARAGFKLAHSSDAVQCRGTDADRYGSGYQREIQTSGRIGSCYSKIVAEQVDALISVPVLKDHNLAGVTLGLKNFFGAIHNPNKYHDDNCDPFVADVVSHPFIRHKWRLTICDGTQAQYNGGPTRKDGYHWPFGGLIISDDVVAADAVAADLLERKRAEEGLRPLARDGRPTGHIQTAAERGLGVADLARIERIEV